MRYFAILAIALGSLLAVAACTPSTTNSPTGAPGTGGPVSTANPGATAPAPSAARTAIEVRDFALDPDALSIPAGSVTLAVTNLGPTPHNVKIRDGAGEVLFGTADLREGESESVTGNLEPGGYVMFCDLAGHESLGIRGTLMVTGP